MCLVEGPLGFCYIWTVVIKAGFWHLRPGFSVALRSQHDYGGAARLYGKDFQFYKKLSICVPEWLLCPVSSPKAQTPVVPLALQIQTWQFCTAVSLFKSAGSQWHRMLSIQGPLPRLCVLFVGVSVPVWCPFGTWVVCFATDSHHLWHVLGDGLCHLLAPSLVCGCSAHSPRQCSSMWTFSHVLIHSDLRLVLFGL